MEKDKTHCMYPLPGMCDFSQGDEKNYSLGFMELLGAQVFCPNSLSDTPQTLSNNPFISVDNFSSISSSSSKVAVNVEPQINDVKTGEHQKEEEEEDADEEKPQRKKGSKPKLKKRKTSEKKPKEHRFVFKTRSEVDFLEDGYRWKKYGQKSAKDRPFPRSYFRCVGASCSVKKRVERCVEDPGVVVTTYEGQHTHPCPPPPPTNTINIPMPPNTQLLLSNYPQQQLVLLQPSANSNNRGYNLDFQNGTINMSFLHERGFGSTDEISDSNTHSGLLQDIVPSSILKQG